MKYKDTNVKVVYSKYMDNDSTAIVLIDKGNDYTYATCTVNLDDYQYDLLTMGNPDRVAIKDYGENEGMVDFLVEQNIITPKRLARIPAGFVSVGVYELTEEARKAREVQHAEMGL